MYKDGTDMEQNEVAIFQRSIVECGDPVEIARKVKLAFKRIPGEMAIACFAKVMTAELPHTIKVAVWELFATRTSCGAWTKC